MKNMDYYNKFLLYIKMGETTYYQTNRETVLIRAKSYYENNRSIKRKAKNKYRELSEEEKNIKIEYGKNRNKKMSEEKKQYQKNYREANKTKKT